LRNEPGIEVEVVNGRRGEFTVQVDGTTVAKSFLYFFRPSVEKVLKAVREAGADVASDDKPGNRFMMYMGCIWILMLPVMFLGLFLILAAHYLGASPTWSHIGLTVIVLAVMVRLAIRVCTSLKDKPWSNLIPLGLLSSGLLSMFGGSEAWRNAGIIAIICGLTFAVAMNFVRARKSRSP
jgi:hypothetical protein